MSGATEHSIDLPAGRFRYLEWPGAGPPVVLLHGLTAVADAWAPTIEALGDEAPRAFALDQRGHGESHPAGGGYGIGAYVADVVAFIGALGLERPHLAGHSMGARVAMVLAARSPQLVRSAAIVDIGPEQWKANWTGAVEAFERMPGSFASDEEALEWAGSRTRTSPVGTALFLARLRRRDDGRLTWRADIEALKRTVRSHRSRNFWREWESIDVPALLVRGGNSHELRPAVAAEMRRRNTAVRYEEIEGVGHNIPLIAPEHLAPILLEFWRSEEMGQAQAVGEVRAK